MQKKKVSLAIRFRRLINRVNHALYWLRCTLFMRYNRIVVKRLPPTWVDRDTLLYHAVFQLIEDFIEKEEPFGSDFSRDGMYSHIRFLLEPEKYTGHVNYRQWECSAEVIEIYLWIKNEFSDYEKRLNRIYSLMSDDLGNWPPPVEVRPGQQLELDFGRRRDDGWVSSIICERIDLEERLQFKTIGEMLHRIVEIRGFLWT